ncbi:LysM peptidoglycan-binding domain-containing protein [Pseudobacteriovorax antillogorgiicola]|uniref:Membrane-bound lytic murein transglycosylase D n=1 Tax=Pseudobacteriovorax antillogorgiicola TaxID=1513793 RepID=A0A1Y6C1C0_9BACT|nr:LysM peptidoglycan-binding domain-containing protein [Pseudobacteriovorax antillogorgiicola]TCS52448.1 membrane-bound lytic murein transglycosylase D [Pseudobacteriovorax antillogorgiicola]SMF28523.1 membrane-bound lytic murein transglycosylase D [Pseudobacteriovorax antillogorgiicola]
MKHSLQIISPFLLLTHFSCTSQLDSQPMEPFLEKPQELHGDEPEVVPDEIDEVIESTVEKPRTEPPPPIGTEKDEINESLEQGIPLEINAEVQRWIEVFTGSHRDMFQRYLNRGERFKPMIITTLRDQGVPTELYYLAMIESGFSTHAYSHAKALGLWQFIAGTGKRYGLRIDRYVDERRDPIRATISASMYLNDLNNVFDSWYLAMAAYNAGELRILRAIMKAKTRDFWQLARGNYLPDETMNYIPKFLAALTIGSNPEKYGFTIEPATDIPPLVSVKVPSPVKLDQIAKLSGVSLKELKENNPHIRRNMTPPGLKEYRLWVPEYERAQVLAVQDGLKTHRLKISSSQRKVARRYHRVRRGETLASISRRYGLTIRQLKARNGLRSNRIYAGSRLIIRDSKSTERYRVRRGDNLNLIARKFNTSVRNIKRLNNLKSTRIYAGQILKVRPRG